MRNLLKYFLLIVLAIIIILLLKHKLNSHETSSDKVVNVYNWGEYIDPELIEEFEQESGYKVEYELFDSNEAMYTKIKSNAGDYDVVVPSEYMVEKMKREDLLIPLDKSIVTNFKNVDDTYLNPGFDQGNVYSAPYFWGTVGIVFNTSMTDLEFNSWDDLWDPSLANNVLLVDGAREIMGMALNSLGYSLNTSDKIELGLAAQKLESLKPNVKGIIGDEVLVLMPKGEAAAAVTWSGSAQDMMSENADLDYSVPDEGSNIWVDSMVIPKTCNNPTGANEFINFMLRPENMAKNAEYVGYSTPMKSPEKYLDEATVSDERFYPPKEKLAKLEYYEALDPELLQYYNDLFLEFKMN